MANDSKAARIRWTHVYAPCLRLSTGLLKNFFNMQVLLKKFQSNNKLG